MSLAPCKRCGAPLEAGDLRCAICAEVAPQVSAGDDAGEFVAQVMRCEGCDAATRYSAQVQGLLCAFCGSVMNQEKVTDPIEQADGYLPFLVDGEGARAAFSGWLASLGWFRPADLRSSARLESLRPLWWVGWVFDAHALVSWTADSNAGARRADWAPHAGQTTLVFDDIAVSASRGLTDDEAYAMVETYDLTTAEEGPGEVEGAPTEAIIEEFDVQRSQARARVLAAIDAVAGARVDSQEVPGSRSRNVHVACLLRELETRRRAFPAWVMAYRYRNRLYRVVISGQDAGKVVGRAPWSWPRILMVAVLVLLVLALVAGLSVS